MRTLFAVCMASLCILVNDPETALSSLYPTSCNVAPYPVDLQQSDQSMLTIVARGNAIIHHVETQDGYTLVKSQEGDYEYAQMNGAGDLVTSGILAHNEVDRSRREKRALNSIDKNLRISEEIREQRTTEFMDSPEYRTSGFARQFPATGNQKLLVILIQYPDLMSEYSEADIEALMNEPGYNGTGSFRDYFLKNSNGQLDLDTDVFGWYTSAENYQYYGYQNGFQRTRQLMAEAIDAAEAAGVDFSQYDNDGDGVVDAVVGLHAGPGAEVGAQTQYIWSHRWTLGASYERTYDGVLVSDYMINPETRPWGMVGVGVLCHEFGHVLGLPDLYDTDNSSSGIGNWGLMANGAWLNLERTPANMDAWSKCAQHWIDPEVITSGVFTLQAADDHAECYRINTSDPNEYFLLENRQKTGNDAYLPGSGLAIWHVDEDKTSLYPASNNVNSDENNKGVDLEEADGLFQLDSGPFQGDHGDLFPGAEAQTFFTANSTPSSHMNDGSVTDISVTNIWEADGLVHFRLNDEVTCAVNGLEIGDQVNCHAGVFDQEVIVMYDYAPQLGQLLINGQSFPITGSPQTVWLSGIPADGSLHGVNVTFTSDQLCILNVEDAFTAPQSYQINIEQLTCDPALEGTTTFNYSTDAGCDSTVTVNTILLPFYDITIRSTTCSFDLAGTFTNVFTTTGGCDSTVTLINEYIQPDTVVIRNTTCEASAVQSETLHLIAVEGCDSIVRLETVLLSSYDQTFHKYSCDPDQSGTETTILQTAQGCDSSIIVITHLVETYDLQILETTCRPEDAGTEILYLTTAHGCDSVVTIITTFTPFSASFETSVNGLEVDFINTSENADRQLWFFGDGIFSFDTQPSHQFNEPGHYQVILATTNADCQQLKMQVVDLVLTDPQPITEPDLEEVNAAAKMMVFPNPTFGPVNVELSGFDEDVVRMSLYDINGNLIALEEMDARNTNYQMDLSDVAPGIYVMQMASGDEVVNEKIFLTN